MRLRLVFALAAAVPSVAAGQAWLVQSGIAARGEYNDNYFFTSTNKESAFTGSVGPFVTATRQTETTDVNALLAVGLNKVWGLSQSTDYVSGRLGLDGTVYDERSTWTGIVAFSRAPLLQSAQTPAGVTLVRAYTDTTGVNGAYSYALTEQLSIGAAAGWFQNNYSAVETGVGGLTDNRGYIAGGTLDYRYSEQTGFKATAMYSNFSSDPARSDTVTTTFGVVHQPSPRLTLSAAVAGYWSDIEARQTALACPSAPFLCSAGLVPQVLVQSGEQRRDSGPLYGGGIIYDFSEATRLAVTFTQSIIPSSTGSISRNGDAAASLTHRFSDRLAGRAGLGYTRTKYPTAFTGWFANDYYVGDVGVSFQLAEHWLLEAGYRYARAEYAEDPSRPASNVAFITIAYNWPAGAFTGWAGSRVGVDLRLGAGPLPLPERRPPPARAGSPLGQPESLPFGTILP